MRRITGLFALFLVSASSQASGLYLYEIATEDTGLASAGQAARAQDASTLVTNPAGLTRLPDRMLTGGLQALYGDTPYTLDDNAALSGESPDNTIGWFPGASVFYHQRLNESVSAGIGLFGNYGLGLDFGDWAGERLIKKSTLVGLTLSPAVAWQINDRLSWGAGVGVNYGFLSLTRIGLAYTSKTEYHFNIDATARFPQLGNTEFTLPLSSQINTPAQLMLSVVHDLNNSWSVMGDLGWQDWSVYGGNQIYFSGQQVERTSRLRDSWHTALGLQFRPDERWRLNAGIAYDSSFYKHQDDTAMTMPSGDAWRFGTGAQYQVTPSSSVGAAFEYLNMSSSAVSSPLLRGEYRDPNLYFFSMNYSHTF